MCKLLFHILKIDKNPSLFESKKVQIVVLSEEGYSAREISAKIRCSKTVMHTAFANFNINGSYKDFNRSTRPMKIFSELI